MMAPDIRVFADLNALSAAAAEALAATLNHAVRANGRGSLVLSGGSTPRTLYQLLTSTWRDEIPWGAVHLFWGDERYVPHTDPHSNYRLAKETLLDHLEVPPRAVHRIRGEAAPEEAAAELDDALEGIELDLLLLGLGPDGHMASLFPGSPQLAVTDRRATYGPAGVEPFVDRITLTVPVIQSAIRIVFLVTGERKADAVARAFGGDVTPDVPASLSRLAPVPVEVFLDEAAASRMSGT
jgi:6-phosphogluconolactonase